MKFKMLALTALILAALTAALLPAPAHAQAPSPTPQEVCRDAAGNPIPCATEPPAQEPSATPTTPPVIRATNTPTATATSTPRPTQTPPTITDKPTENPTKVTLPEGPTPPGADEKKVFDCKFDTSVCTGCAQMCALDLVTKCIKEGGDVSTKESYNGIDENIRVTCSKDVFGEEDVPDDGVLLNPPPVEPPAPNPTFPWGPVTLAGLVGLGIGLLLPAIQKVREAAARHQGRQIREHILLNKSDNDPTPDKPQVKNTDPQGKDEIPFDAFLKIEGVPGESTDEPSKGTGGGSGGSGSGGSGGSGGGSGSSGGSGGGSGGSGGSGSGGGSGGK